MKITLTLEDKKLESEPNRLQMILRKIVDDLDDGDDCNILAMDGSMVIYDEEENKIGFLEFDYSDEEG